MNEVKTYEAYKKIKLFNFMLIWSEKNCIIPFFALW